MPDTANIKLCCIYYIDFHCCIERNKTHFPLRYQTRNTAADRTECRWTEAMIFGGITVQSYNITLYFFLSQNKYQHTLIWIYLLLKHQHAQLFHFKVIMVQLFRHSWKGNRSRPSTPFCRIWHHNCVSVRNTWQVQHGSSKSEYCIIIFGVSSVISQRDYGQPVTPFSINFCLIVIPQK